MTSKELETTDVQDGGTIKGSSRPSLYCKNEKFASSGYFNRTMLKIPEVAEALEDEDCFFGPFCIVSRVPGDSARFEVGLCDAPIVPGAKVDIQFRTQLGGHLIYLVTSLDPKARVTTTISAAIFDVGFDGGELPGTRRAAPLQLKDDSLDTYFFQERNKMWMSEKLVLTVENLGKDDIFPYDFVVVMEVDSVLNKPETTRYGGSPGFTRGADGRSRQMTQFEQEKQDKEGEAP